jgi:DNA-binding transcriptional regulator LsrR (DeoR family)
MQSGCPIMSQLHWWELVPLTPPLYWHKVAISFPKKELDFLRQAKAAGDILLRFYNQNGNLVETGLEKRVISMRFDQLSKVSRAVGVAGGSRKYAAVLGALRGHWINVLVTGHFTAKRLANEYITSTGRTLVILSCYEC